MPRSKRAAHARARWALQDAKNKFSEVVEAAVVISYREYERFAAARRGQTPSLTAYLLAMPAAPGAAGAIERIELHARQAAL